MRVLFERNVVCPMRDHVNLMANIFRPEMGGPYPVLLTRLPYGKDTGFAYGLLDPVRLAETGYIIVIQDVRGCFASEGTFDGFLQEFEDGYDTVEWASKLPGSDGQVGMFGASYYAYTEWAAAASAHPALKVLVPTVALDDGWEGVTFRNGALEWGMAASWYSSLAPAYLLRTKKDDSNFKQLFARLIYDSDHLSELGYFELPLDQFGALKHADILPEFFDQITRTTYDETWRAISIKPHYKNMDVSALLIGGWYDVFQKSTIDAFQQLQSFGQDVRLLIGPWTHVNYSNAVGDREFGMAADSSFLNFQYDRTTLHQLWFDYKLKGQDNVLVHEPPIKLFVMGENTWRYASEWPLPETVFTKYYLHYSDYLSTVLPGGEQVSQYIYDPANPVLTTGGNLLMTPKFRPGPIEQTDIESRSDVLVFTSDVLTAPLEVIGPIRAQLWVSTTAKDTDFVVRLTDVDQNGKSINLADGIVRMRYRDSIEHPELIEPGEVYAIEVDLWATGNVFLVGHRIRVQITSSNFPRWNRNLNTGASNESTEDSAIATQTILHDVVHPSHIILPVIPRLQ